MVITFNDNELIKMSVKQIRAMFKGKRIQLELALKRKAELSKK